ncbi:CsgG/HfaB family protein [Asticcacaulis benevestitus]|uniref:Curli production assembly/transport component CsgG n=1 Tax=Asticcacaulis benevestitus DSM 16100 = ATCC BAA-896 TaxID=1121022 RepID=V4Q4D7_9CAUL|nr:CsgG/HfaB family protein [Asticcacaulis benevestitus]ESQ92680.1 hypothetical protein ABENE_07620 [Asticcacaulis benevestitus DSM 16100 = ATCC BAA-896]
MRKTSAFLSTSIGMLMAGSAFAQTTVKEVDIRALVPHCEAPAASVLIGRIDCKASACSAMSGDSNGKMSGLMAMAQMAQGNDLVDLSQLGAGTASALTTALNTTGCFKVQDRGDIESLKKAAEDAGIEFKARPVDYLVTGTITSVSSQTNSNNLAGGIIPVVGAFKKTKKHADLTIDIRVIDAHTSEVALSKTFQVSSERSNWSFGGGGYSNGLMLGGVSSTKSPELDSVANEVVINATGYLAENLAGPNVTAHAQTLPQPAKK